MTDPRYPIGPFSFDITPTPQDRERNIEAIAVLPSELRAVLADVTPADLDRTYRPGGWTVRQLVHHLPDSHLNGYVRHKLLLTEDQPTIKPYDEHRWAQLRDTTDTPITVSLALLEALHQRWTVLLRSLHPDDFLRCYVHPEVGRAIPLDVSLANYAWHGQHHAAHIRMALSREG